MDLDTLGERCPRRIAHVAHYAEPVEAEDAGNEGAGNEGARGSRLRTPATRALAGRVFSYGLLGIALVESAVLFALLAGLFTLFVFWTYIPIFRLI